MHYFIPKLNISDVKSPPLHSEFDNFLTWLTFLVPSLLEITCKRNLDAAYSACYVQMIHYTESVDAGLKWDDYSFIPSHPLNQSNIMKIISVNVWIFCIKIVLLIVGRSEISEK